MEAMPARTIARTKVDAWISRLLEDAEVVAPVAAEGGDVLYRPVTVPQDVLWEFDNSLQPPKEYVLPQTEPLLAIRAGDHRVSVSALYDLSRRVLFNVRSCDASGIAFLAHISAADLPDPHVLHRLAHTTIVTLACSSPCRDGFCVCSGSGPFLTTGFDVQLVDLGEGYLAEVGSAKGRALLDRASDLFREPTAAEREQRQRAEEKALGEFGEQTCHFASATRRVSTGRVAEALWEAMSPWCLECGGCNHVCPTCYCFSVKDRAEEAGWTRCRLWDSCQLAAFTMEASGHNPRPRRADRIKRRFFHKVSAQYYQRDGMVGCVGCGRCVQVCLGTTHMPAVVAAIRKGEWHG